MATVVKLFMKKNDVKKDGTTSIYVLIRIDNVEKLYHTGISINAGNFDNDKGIVKNADPNYMKLNHFLSHKKQEYISIVLDIENSGQKVTHELLAGRISLGSKIDFIKFCEKELANLKGNISDKHYTTMLYQISKLKGFYNELPATKVDRQFLESYEKRLKMKGNKTNTIAGDFRMIRIFVNKARKQGIIKINPFDDFTIRAEQTRRDFLTLEEVKKLEELYFSETLAEAQQRTLNCFLKSCYTGVRIGDHKKISKDTIDGKMFILKMGKTKRTVYIPVTNRALTLIDDSDKKNFNPLPQKNHRINEQIRDIIKIAGIKKEITYHSSRHTFAVVSLTIGMDLKVVSEILGHTTVKTTEIYAKIVNELKTSQMAKWDNF